MTDCRSEITLKFSELPEAISIPGKKVSVVMTDNNGLTFTAIINAKSWRKAEASAAEFADWAGMISGKLGSGENGLEVLDAGIQVFEKKAKAPKEEVNEVTNATS